MAPAPHRIDVHNHIVPDLYRAALNDAGLGTAGGIAHPQWSRDLALGTMDRNGIATAITSISSPGVHFGDDGKARALARQCNEFSARLVADRPARFGAFAVLTGPDMSGSLKELEYALDTLKLDGVVLLASMGERFLGDPAFNELYAELDRRKAVVFIHPTLHPTTKLIPLEMHGFMCEFMFDTTRAAANLIYSGTLDRYPNIRFILAHAGATVPYISWRLEIAGTIDPRVKAKVPNGFAPYLKRYYYDTALSASPQAMSCLTQVVDTGQILFGSDWPHAPEPITTASVKNLSSMKVFDDAQRKTIERENGLKLFPRLQKVLT